MNETKWRLIEQFPGFVAKRDFTQVAQGALILGSQNVLIGDDDQVTVRKGSVLFKAMDGTTEPGTSLHTFIRRDSLEIMMAAAGTVLEYYHPTTGQFENLNDGYTDGAVFGFQDHNVNEEYNSFVYFCNAIEPYSRWTGEFDTLDGTYAGGETEVSIVGDIFEDTVFDSGTASSVTTTTVVMPAGTFVTDLYNNFYIHITSGAQAGKVSLISATSDTTLTFAAIAGLSGTPTWEVRAVRFEDGNTGRANQTLRIGTTDVTYTGFTDLNTFSGVSNMPAASDGDAMCQAVQEYKDAPRGNILKVMHTRMFMAGIKSSGSATSTPGSASTLHFSQIADATDWTFSAIRAADEGGIQDFPDQGGPLTSLAVNEDVLYVYKRDVTYTLTFTQDGNDIPQIAPLLGAHNVGAVNHKGTVKTDSDIFYISEDSVVRSVRRPEVTDFARPQQISDPIKLLLQRYTNNNAASIYRESRTYIATQTEDGSSNDTVFVYDFEKQAWHAPYIGWSVADWTIYNGKLYFISSVDAKVHEAEAERYDDNGTPYKCVARFAYDNLGQRINPKKLSLLFVEGYISQSTTTTHTLRYDYLGATTSKSSTLAGTESTYIVADPDFVALGKDPLGQLPLGANSLDDDTLTDLQKFRVTFTTTEDPEVHEYSYEISSNAVGARWSLLAFGTNAEVMRTRQDNFDKKLA